MARVKECFGKTKLRGLAAFGLFLLASAVAFAQLPTGTILGMVKDSTGGAVAGATVTVTNTDTGVTRTGPTTDDGSFRFPALGVGHYGVKVTKDGFQTLDRTGMTLNVGSDINLELALQVGSTSQSVVVTGEAPLIDTTSSSSGNLVNEDKVTDLPLNGRNWIDLTLMQPGITQINALGSFTGTIEPAGEGGLLFVTNGGTDRSNLILLDGADERTAVGWNSSSATGTSLGVDGIKEYKIVSVLPSAEYGLVMGSQTTIVSKGGSNQWHGDGFDFLRNASLDANPYNVALDSTDHNNCPGNATQDLFSFPCKRIAPFQRNNFGGSVGGPIKKDKAFIFGTYEGIEQRVGSEPSETTLPTPCFVDAGTGLPVQANPDGTPVTVPAKVAVPSVIQSDACVPGSSAHPITVNPVILSLAQFFALPNVPLTSVTRGFNYQQRYTVPTSESYGQARFDYTFSSNDSAFVRYTHDDSETHPLTGSDLRSQNDVSSSEIFTTASETHIFTPTVLNTFRFSVSRNMQNLAPETVPSTTPGLPTYPVNATTLFATDSSNPLGQVGTASPGQIPQLLIPNLNGCSAGSANPNCYSTYGGASVPSSYATPGPVDSNIYTLSDDIYWSKGKHAFKFGMLVNRNDWYPWSVGFANGTASFPGTNSPEQTSSTFCANVNSCPLAAYFEGVYNSLGRATPNSIYARQFRHYTYGFYGQDDFKALSRLTLNLGLRYEFATVPHEINPALAFTLRFPQTDKTGTAGPMFTNPTLHNFSPRVGFAWDVFGNGKTALRGGAGIYYDIGTYGNLELSNGVAVPNNQIGGSLSGTVTYTNPDIQNLPGGTCCSVTNTYRPGGTLPGGKASATSPFSVPLPAVANTAVVSPRSVDYNLQQPTLVQRVLGIDQQLPAGIVLSVSYVGARDWHLYQEREGNPQAYFPTMVAGATCNAGNIDSQAGCPGVLVGGAAPTVCPSAGCTAVTVGANGLPYYCSPADGTTGAPSAAHPCFSNAASIACTTLLNSPTPSCPGKTNPVWNQVSNVTTSGDSYYNSLQIVVNKRASHGFQFQAGYTWQKLLDTGTGQSTLENAIQPHEFPTSGSGASGTLDRQPASYGATNSIHFNFIYRPGDIIKSNGILAKVANGWGISAIETLQSGYPLSLTMSGDRSLYNAAFVVERVDLCPGFDASQLKSSATNTGNRNSSTFFNPNMFCLPPSGVLGNSAGGILTGPGYVTTNLSFTKDTKVKFLGEAGNIEFRFEMFNAFNHPNFGSPNTTIFAASSSQCPAGGSITTLTASGCGSEVSSTAGRDSLGTLTQMRQLQGSLKFLF